tara:strand:- start:566 stop:724 length:159 start_codon:yes stop_codon:yes gene_type:complete
MPKPIDELKEDIDYLIIKIDKLSMEFKEIKEILETLILKDYIAPPIKKSWFY